MIMTKKKQYTSVSAMLADSGIDKSIKERIEKRIAGRQLIKHLMAMRALRDMSQKDVAEKIGCTQSRISKLERSTDEDLRLGDLHNYANAVGMDVGVLLADKERTSVDWIKHHAFQIKRLLERLAKLANIDESIEKGVTRTFRDTLFNLIKIVCDSSEKLPQEDNAPFFRVQLIEIDDDEEDDFKISPDEDVQESHTTALQ